MSGAVPEESSSDSKPFWSSPWLVAFIAGAITITSIRDCTRRIPDPPSAIGQVPAWSLPVLKGEVQTSEALQGQVYILAFGAVDCASVGEMNTDDASISASCGVATEAAQSLQAQLAEKKAAAKMVIIDAANSWKKALLLTAALADFDDRQIAQPWDLGFILVDSDGGCRGFYGLHDEGQDEVLHRSQHVARAEVAGE